MMKTNTHVVVDKSNGSVTARNLETGKCRTFPDYVMVSTWHRFWSDGTEEVNAISLRWLSVGTKFYTGNVCKHG